MRRPRRFTPDPERDGPDREALVEAIRVAGESSTLRDAVSSPIPDEVMAAAGQAQATPTAAPTMVPEPEQDPEGAFADAVNEALDQVDAERSGGDGDYLAGMEALGLNDVYAVPDGVTGNPARESRYYLARFGRSYAEPYILKAVHRLLLRGVPTIRIARMFGVQPPTVERWRLLLRNRMAEEVEYLNPTEVTGHALAVYREIGETAMLEFSSVDAIIRVQDVLPNGETRTVTTVDKAAASYKTRMAQIAVAAQKGASDVLESIGVFDRVRGHIDAEQQGRLSDADSFSKMISTVFDDDAALDELFGDGGGPNDDEAFVRYLTG